MGFFSRVKKRVKPKTLEEIINDFDTESFYALVLSYNTGLKKQIADSLNVSDMDEFKWAINKRLVRENLKLISSTDDEEILKKMASYDSRPLFSIYSFSNDEVRLAAIKKLNDIDFLLGIAPDITNKAVFGAILEKIDDDSILFDIAIDPKYNMSGHRYTINRSRRIMAAEMITDETLLGEIIAGAGDCQTEVSIEAAKNLKNPDMIIDLILSNDLNYDVLDCLLSNLGDDYLDIVIRKSKRDVKSRAMNHITNHELILEYASDKNPSIREFAATNISNEDVLERMAKTDRTAGVRASAVKNIQNQDVLREIVKTDDSNDVRISAIRNSITDNELLKEVCLTDESEEVRKQALFKMSDDNALADLALKTDDAQLKYKAIYKIEDEAVLAKVNEKIPLRRCPNCGSYKVEYGDFYDPSTDYFVYGDRCRSCYHIFNETPK